jgi:hypothetical protein
MTPIDWDEADKLSALAEVCAQGELDEAGIRCWAEGMGVALTGELVLDLLALGAVARMFRETGHALQ